MLTAARLRLEPRLASPRRARARERAMRALGYSKVFGVGAARTGTSSLGRALVALGFRHKSWDLVLWNDLEAGKLELIFARRRPLRVLRRPAAETG